MDQPATCCKMAKQIAAGYILYGPSTMLVYSIGKEFTRSRST